MYLSWLLDAIKIDGTFEKIIMMLPYTVFHEFEEIQDNKNYDYPRPIYNEIVKQQQRDIFDTSLTLIFIYRDFCWSLAVLVDFDKANVEPNKKPITDSNPEPSTEKNDELSNRPKTLYFVIRSFTNNIDPRNKLDSRHADKFMENKITSFVDYCWRKRLSLLPRNDGNILPKSYPVTETNSMIPSLSADTTGKHTATMFNYFVQYCLHKMLETKPI